MPVPQNETLGDLQRLSAALEANASDFEHIPGVLTEFHRLVAEIQDAATQQAILTAAKLEATKRFQTLMKSGLEQAALLRRAAGVRYGRDSEKLAQFGVQPYRGRKSAKPQADPPTPPTPPNIEPEVSLDAEPAP